MTSKPTSSMPSVAAGGLAWAAAAAWLLALCSVFGPGMAWAADHYVSPAGSDTGGDGSRGSPWQTVSFATGAMEAGDTLILMDGEYGGMENLVEPPSGTAEGYTVVKAENDGGAVIDGTDMAGQYDYPLTIDSREYVIIEGLAVRNKSNSELIVVSNSHHVKIMRTSAVNKLNYAGSIVRITGDSHHVLLEDVWVAGAGRYGIIVFKPTAYPDEAPHQIILRRCVVRHDYRQRDTSPDGDQVYPVKGIQVYGAQPGDDSTLVTREVLLQNNIVLDWNYGEEYYQGEGGMGATARVNDIAFYGNIVLNIKGQGTCLPDPWGCSYGSLFTGYGVGDNRLGDGGNFTIVNNAAWDTSGSGVWFTSGSEETSKIVLIDQNTIGAVDGDQGGGPRAVVDSYAHLQATVTNNLFFETGLAGPGYGPGGSGSYAEEYNWYYPADLMPDLAESGVTDMPDLLYIPMTPDTGTGEGGRKRGATILKRYGAPGSLWDDDGYDLLTDEDLWPWPHEDLIKAAFSEINDPPGNAYPQTNDTRRGFCSEGTGLYGGPVTLTSYIWEYLGNPCPPEICTYGAQLVITTLVLPDAVVNVPYAATMQAVGGAPPYGWAVTGGSLPPAIDLASDTGELSGTTTAEGIYSFTVEVTDGAGDSDTQELSLSVTSGPPESDGGSDAEIAEDAALDGGDEEGDGGGGEGCGCAVVR
jgi:hypothetical protein